MNGRTVEAPKAEIARHERLEAQAQAARPSGEDRKWRELENEISSAKEHDKSE